MSGAFFENWKQIKYSSPPFGVLSFPLKGKKVLPGGECMFVDVCLIVMNPPNVCLEVFSPLIRGTVLPLLFVWREVPVGGWVIDVFLPCCCITPAPYRGIFTWEKKSNKHIIRYVKLFFLRNFLIYDTIHMCDGIYI